MNLSSELSVILETNKTNIKDTHLTNIRIVKIELANYRNYEAHSLDFHPRCNLITGLNGVGKTTILDAVYYLCNGKSYFTRQDKHIYRYEQSFFRVQGEAISDDQTSGIRIISKAGTKKAYELDEKTLKSKIEILGRFPAFMIAPKDAMTFFLSSSERRKLIDRTISLADKDYLAQLLTYNRLLKQRNAYLLQIGRSGRLDENVMLAFDEKMSASAKNIHDKRARYISDLAILLRESHQLISAGQEEISAAYDSELFAENLLSLMQKNRQKDQMLGRTNSGIHKDDLELLIDGNPIKRFASQGQLKSGIIALKLAQMEWVKKVTQKKPILLLDDIFDKLDNQRVTQLLELVLDNMASQVFITDTDTTRVAQALDSIQVDFSQHQL